MDLITRDDLEEFRIKLLSDLKNIVESTINTDYAQEWLKNGDLKKMLRVSDGTLQNLRISGKLKPVKIEGTYYYNRAEVLELFKRKC